MDGYIRAFSTTDIPNGSSRLWRHDSKRIAVWRVRDRFFAADNRCPHEGYALVKGDVKDDVLTCAWHNWKFRLADGENLRQGENLRTYPVQVRDGALFIDVTDPEPEQIAPQLFGSLLEAMGDVNTGRLARDTMRLRSLGTPLTDVIKVGVDYGATRAEYGWNHSLATLADCLTMAAAFEGPLSALPVVQGLSVVSQTEVRRPPRPQPDPVDVIGAYGSVADALKAFPGLVDAERDTEAEGLLRGALRAGAAPDAVRHAFLSAITDHFLGYGHPMIYCQKAFDLLDRIGWSEAETVLAPLVPAITWSTRYDKLPYMRRFLKAWEGASGASPVAADLPALRRILLDGMPEDAVAGVLGALDGGVAVPDVINLISSVAASRLGRFDMDSDIDDSRDAGWLDVTHTLTYTNALRWAWARDPSPEVLRGVLHAAWFTQWTQKFDARDTPPPVQARAGSDADAVLGAIRRRDPQQAVALVKGYDGPEVPLERALTQAAAEDNAAAPIMVAHTVKTAMAALAESRVGGDRAPLAAAARFLAAPKRESFVYRSTLDAIDFIAGRAKGDTELRAAVGAHGDLFPLAPFGQPRLVVGGRDGQRRGAEEQPQRRLVGVDHLQDRLRRRGRVAGAGARPLGPLAGGVLADLVVVGQRRGVPGGRPAPVRGERAGLDDRHLHAERLDFLGEGLAQSLQRPLRRVVHADVLERRDPADRRDLQDVARVLAAQDGQRGLGDPQRAEHVRLELVARVGLGQFLDHAELAVAGVVDDDVEPSEVPGGQFHRREVRRAVVDVQLQRQQRVAELLAQVIQRGGVARGGGHLVSALQRGDRPLASEAFRCSRDEPGLHGARPTRRDQA